MSIAYIQRNYIHRISFNFDRFKERADYFNFRCPFCGDSSKVKRKARGFLIERDGEYGYYCHNCGASHRFDDFLKLIDSNLHKQYRIEKLKINAGYEKIKAPQPEVKRRTNAIVELFDEKEEIGFSYDELIDITKLSEGHPVVSYLIKRGIDKSMHGNFLYAREFVSFASQFIDTMKDAREHPRLIIPFKNDCGSDVFQARAFGKETPKYITIKYDETAIKVYGLHRVDRQKPVYVVEGPIDSMFLENAIAVCSSSLMKTFYSYDLGIQQKVFVWDNEPRNKEIVDLVEQAIDRGESVVIWDSSPLVKQDINDLILSGYSKEQIMQKIKIRTFQGPRAKMELSRWRRV